MFASRVWFCLSALVVGVGSAWCVVRCGGGGTVDAGAWKSTVLAGSVHADPYTRARVALGGLLALGPEETVYYVASTDEVGKPLSAHCHYRITGPAPSARWWSVTAYAEDRFLFADPQHRYSINNASPGLPPGQVTLVTGPAPLGTGPWLPTSGEGGLLLVLRLYQPGPAVRLNASALVPLRIQLEGACP
jgi:hypothetical protein